ncbi:MAG TPA: hypothetical protein PKY05_00745, partial [Fibrobacteria bacterium]|nr:hypothetical protein [Fibrobacteria bacterium]
MPAIVCGASLHAGAADNPAYLQIAATDALKRTIASPEAVGQKRAGRAVGVFYFLASGFWNDAVTGPFSLEEILNKGGIDARLNPFNSEWNGSDGHKLYQHKPLLGYYRSNERWAVRRNMQMLTLAGIDFIALDFTNAEVTSPEVRGAAWVVMEEIESLRLQGWNPPRVVFYTNTNSGAYADSIYKFFYDPALPNRLPNTWYQVNGKPLLIGVASGISSATAVYFTLRESQWPNSKDAAGNFIQKDGGWPWIEFVRPQRVYSISGVRDAISVSVAQHADDQRMSTYPFYGTDLNWGRGYAYGIRDHSALAIQRGSNIEEQWSHALAQDVPFTFVTGWNEGGAVKNVEDVAALGWVGQGTTSGCGFREGGTFGCDLTGQDPSMITNQWILDPNGNQYPVSSTTNNIVRVEYSVSPAPTSNVRVNAQLFYSTFARSTIDELNVKTESVMYAPGFQTVEFDMSAEKFWDVNLEQLRFDPPSWPNSTSFEVRKITLMSSNGQVTREWDFGATSNFTDGWFAGNGITGFGRQSSGTVGGTITGSDPHVESPTGIGTDLNANKFIRIRMRNGTSDATAQIYFTTAAEHTPDEFKRVNFAITPNDPGFTDYVLDMSKVPGWTGSLDQLRLDPAANASSGSFSVDHIRIGTASATALPAISWDFGPIHYTIDAADFEFGRDMEPSSGVVGDNYYMQLVDFTRKQTGTEVRMHGSAVK